jgi:putative two-component system response regulator
MTEPHDVLTLMKNERNRNVLRQQLNGNFNLVEQYDVTSDAPPFGEAFDLIVLDRPSMEAYADELAEVRNESEPVILPTLLLSKRDNPVPESEDGNRLFDDMVQMPVKQSVLEARMQNLLEKRKLSLKLKVLNENLQTRVQKKTQTVRDREEKIVMRLVSASTYRDEETGGHIQRLGLYSEVMARELGWEDQRIEDIRLAATMHDIGKIGIEDDILKHPGDLSDEQFNRMKDHTTIGGDIIGDSEVKLLSMAKEIALTHHEQWDGSGYPNGLEGTEIPEAGRLVAVIDVYDALVHDRVYRDAMPEQKALDIIKEDSGTHFDPEMVDCFFEVLPSIRAVRQLKPDEEFE